MSKKHPKSKIPKEQKQPTNPPVNIVLPDSLSAEEMQQIITNALLAAKDIEEQRAKQQKKEDQKKLREAMGYKDYSDKKGLKKMILVFANRVKMFIKFLFVPEALIKGDDATFGLLRISVELFFWVAEHLTTVATMGIIAYIPLQYIIDVFPVLSVWNTIILGAFALPLFLFSRMFRMASIEIQKMEDRNLFFGILASVTSIISVVIATMAVIIDIGG